MDNSKPAPHIAFAALLALVLALPVFGLLADAAYGNSEEETSNTLRDSWKAGLIDGAFLFNEHLSDSRIKTTVNGSSAHLTGTVRSTVESALAEQIALSVAGITFVKNELVVATQPTKRHALPAHASFADATVTTKVKSQLLANTETNGLNIDVNTTNNVVTLTGEVTSGAEKELAYYITRNTGGVRQVVNKIAIEPRA